MDEELDLLKAIYCSTSEFCKVDNNHPPIRKIEANIKVDDELFVNTKFEIDVTNYPDEIRSITAKVTCKSSGDVRKFTSLLESHLYDKAKELKGEPMLIELCQEASSFCSALQINIGHDQEVKQINGRRYVISLIHFDHMRNVRQYEKTLERWINSDFQWARLLQGGKGNIFLILVSDDPAALTDFLKKLKTENIDIDASGRPCKEKMSKVLASNCPLEDYTCDDMQSWNNKIDIETEAAFQVVPFTERKRQFRELTLEKLYTDFASF